MAQQIQFFYVTQSEYDGLTNKNAGGLYFTSDTNKIYRGTVLFANGKATSSGQEGSSTPSEDCLLKTNTSNVELAMKNNSEFVIRNYLSNGTAQDGYVVFKDGYTQFTGTNGGTDYDTGTYMTLADGFEAIRSYKTSGNPDEAEDLPTYIDGKISSYTGFVKTNYNNEGTKYVNLVNTGLSFRSLTSATAEPQGTMTLNDGGWVEFSGDLGGTDYQGNASITLSNGFDSIQAYGTDEGGSNQTLSDFMAVSSNIYQLKRPVTGTAIELVKNRSYYTKTITSNTTLSITVPAAPPYSSGNNQVNWDNIAITFEIELNIKTNNLTIGYPWTWIDDFLAPDLSKAGCYTIAIRGNRRNGTWKWRANLQDTEPAF